MIDFTKASREFERYLDNYDRNDDKIRLKIVHTYGVVRQSMEVARLMKLSDEDIELAGLIALLHDIGRFEQLRRFHSWDARTMDHAAYGVSVLFKEGLIQRFTDEAGVYDIILTAIARHSDYSLKLPADARTLLHARLIRDADKLDNCRVKLEEPIEVLLDASPEEVGRMEITPRIADAFFRNECILSPDRITKADYWVSYIAYFYDINFRESFSLIQKNNYVSRIIRRIPYTNPDTAEMMDKMESHMNAFVEKSCQNGL